MKKTVIVLALLIFLVGCGPSAKDLQLIQDLETFAEQLERDETRFSVLDEEYNENFTKSEYLAYVEIYLEELDLFENHINAFKKYGAENKEQLNKMDINVVQDLMDIEDYETIIKQAREKLTEVSTLLSSTTEYELNTNYFDTIMHGVYPQYNNLYLSLVTFELTNLEEEPITVKFMSEIKGYTEQAVNTETIEPGKTVVVDQSPMLKSDELLSELKNANLYFKVTKDDQVLDEQTKPITLYASDTMVWGIEENGEFFDTSDLLGAWVTPHVPLIDELVRDAADFIEGGMTGYQCYDCRNDDDFTEYAAAQVAAIYYALQDWEVVYVNSPVSFSKSEEVSQKVRLPTDSLELASANCIDGVVVFASALENIGMSPNIAIVPGHAFLCWDIYDDIEAPVDCLETTMVSSEDFIDALDEGRRELNEYDEAGELTLLSVKLMREEGIVPME